MENFDYEHANIADKISLLGELEHAYRHACRSVVVAVVNDDDYIPYQIVAKRAKTLRRKLMAKWFSLKETDHCLCKVASSLRQLAYEINDGDTKTLKEVDDLADRIWGNALDMDMSGCLACKEDSKNKS